jgi:hypothetical protein
LTPWLASAEPSPFAVRRPIVMRSAWSQTVSGCGPGCAGRREETHESEQEVFAEAGKSWVIFDPPHSLASFVPAVEMCELSELSELSPRRRWFGVPKLSKLLNQEDALSALCSRGDFQAPQARPRGDAPRPAPWWPAAKCTGKACRRRTEQGRRGKAALTSGFLLPQ